MALISGGMAILIGSLISSIVSSIATTASSKYSAEKTEEENEKNREYNSQLQQQQNQFNAEQAELANQREIANYEAYKSPSALAKQYQQAGLSKSLMYSGTGSSVGTMNVHQATGASVSPYYSDAVGAGQVYNQIGSSISQTGQNVMNSYVQFKQGQKLESDKQLATAETTLTNFKATGQDLENKFASATMPERIEIVNQQLQNLQKSNEYLNEQVRLGKVSADTAEQLYNVNVAEQTNQLKLTTAQMSANLDKTLVETGVQEETAKKIQAEVAKMQKELELEAQRINNEYELGKQRNKISQDANQVARERLTQEKQQFDKKVETDMAMFNNKLEQEYNLKSNEQALQYIHTLLEASKTQFGYSMTRADITTKWKEAKK